MSTSTKAAPDNVYVNLDCALPASLKLRLGQNLIFVRAFSCAGGPFLRSLRMPAPFFVTADDLGYKTKIPGQPEGTYLVALGLVHSAGQGEILIKFDSHPPCTASHRPVRLKFSITC